MIPTLRTLRRIAIASSLFEPVPLGLAVHRLGFVQADPDPSAGASTGSDAAPPGAGLSRGRPGAALRFARHRGRLLRQLRVPVPRRPRADASARRLRALAAAGAAEAAAVLDFVRERGRVHPREVDAIFSHGTVTNYWGGSSSATTHLLDQHALSGTAARGRARGRHPRLRAAASTRLDAAPAERRARLDALVDVLVASTRRCPPRACRGSCNRLRFAVPQWERRRQDARCARARQRLRAREGGRHRLVLAGREELPCRHGPGRRGAAPGAFRPRGVGSPAVRGVLGLGVSIRGLHARAEAQARLLRAPLLWRDAVIGWANVSAKDGVLDISCGYTAGSAPRGARSHRPWSESAIV